MGYRKTEPVRYTCPDIDRAKSNITYICKSIKAYIDANNLEGIEQDLQYWLSDLEDIGFGNLCQLEELRSSNSALRDWGHEMYNEANELEIKNDELEIKVKDLEQEIDNLKIEISDLEKELEYV